MRKLFLMTTAVAMLFSACNRGDAPKDSSAGNLKVSITTPANRAVQVPGTAANAAIDPAGNHFIFLIDGNNNVTVSEVLVPAEVMGAGQVISDVTSSWRVYVVLNAADASVGTLTTLAAIKAAGVAVTSVQALTPGGFIPMSNDGDAVSMVPSTGSNFESVIEVSPVLTRLELGNITGGMWTDPNDAQKQVRITGFDVTGVYVDGYYPNFTYSGAGGGTMFEMNQTFVTTGIGDTGSWSATGYPITAHSGTGTVWAYNLAPGAAPRLIISVTNVATESTTNGGTNWIAGTTITDPRYITVHFASDAAGNTLIDDFVRGSIYQVSAVTFYSDNLHTSPNPIEVDLSVAVTIKHWTLVPTYGVAQ